MEAALPPATLQSPRASSRTAGLARFGRPGARFALMVVPVAVLLGIPVAVVVASLLGPYDDIWGHLLSTVFVRYVSNTAVLTLGVIGGTLVIGVATAWLVTMCQFPGRRFFEWALLLPLAMPAYVLAYAYTGLLDVPGPVQEWVRVTFDVSYGQYWFPEIRSMGGAITLLTLVLYPYVYMLSRAAFLEQSVCVLEVSRTLGCSPWRAFLTVALPLARPAIVAGLALAAMETLGDFGTVDYFAVDTFTTGIFRTWFGLGEVQAAAQLAGILLVFVLVVLVLERTSRRGARFHHTSGRYRALARFDLGRGRALAAFMACLLPLMFGFLLPAGVLANWASASLLDGGVDDVFLTLVSHSMQVALMAAGLAVVLGLIMAYALRLSSSRVTRAAVRVASMGYAVPGTVVAVGVVIPFAWFDNSVDQFLRDTAGISSGLLLSGTLAALVFAYLVRFMAISVNTLEASLTKVTPSMDAAARTLGERTWGTLRRVHFPLLSGSVLTAALLVFVDVLKELPATLILRPFNFNTLAVRAYELASDERLHETGLPALAIVMAGLLPIIILSRSIARSRPGQEGARP